jgi:catechol 2,3-dioxygenase-like lactoylglutathione lyase family enzyme
MIKKVHHVAYRCADAKQTVEWYGKYLKMNFLLAIAEDEVPSTKEPDPYMHIFLDAGGGNVLAFFELPTRPPMARVVDETTPSWTQHLALELESMDEMLVIKARLEADGIDVVGPTNHTLFTSIYFFDPSGHRIELAVNSGASNLLSRLDEVKWPMLEEWARTKRAPQHARWMHDGSLASEEAKA